MCIRSGYIANAVAALCAADAACDRDWAREATAAILALPSAALANPLALAGGLIKAGLCDREEFGLVVRRVSRTSRGYAYFMNRQGDLFTGMPAKPEKKTRERKAPAVKARPKRSKAAKPRRRARRLVISRAPAAEA